MTTGTYDECFLLIILSLVIVYSDHPHFPLLTVRLLCQIPPHTPASLIIDSALRKSLSKMCIPELILLPSNSFSPRGSPSRSSSSQLPRRCSSSTSLPPAIIHISPKPRQDCSPKPRVVIVTPQRCQIKTIRRKATQHRQESEENSIKTCPTNRPKDGDLKKTPPPTNISDMDRRSGSYAPSAHRSPNSFPPNPPHSPSHHHPLPKPPHTLSLQPSISTKLLEISYNSFFTNSGH